MINYDNGDVTGTPHPPLPSKMKEILSLGSLYGLQKGWNETVLDSDSLMVPVDVFLIHPVTL